MNRPMPVVHTSTFISAALIVLLLIISVVWVLLSSHSFDWQSSLLGLLVPAGLFIYAIFYTFIRPVRRISSMSVEAGLLIMFSHVGCVFGYLIATSPFPLQDELLVHMDRMFGFDWLVYSKFVFSSPALRTISLIFYNLTLPLVVVTMVWLSLKGKTAQSSKFVLTIIIGAIVCISISWVIPAAGAVGYYAPDESLYQGLPIFIDIHYKQDYFELRDGKAFVISLTEPKGLVAFPSYHVCMAVLILLALLKEGPLFWLMLVANALTIASTPIDGGHHLVDILGGMIVAVACYKLVHRLDCIVSKASKTAL